MIKFNQVAGFASILLLAACVNTQNVDQIRRMQPMGSSYNDVLAQEYRTLALYEGDEMQDWASADRFADKALRASRGETVDADMVSDYQVADAVEAANLQAARSHLSSKKNAGASAARAQAKFDCWLEQAAEGVQPTHIAKCRQEFCAAMAEMTSEKGRAWDPVYCEPRKVAVAMNDYVVYFALGSAEITSAGTRVIQSAAAEAKSRGNRVSVVGHTDRSGSNGMNMALSSRRADAVRRALINNGVNGQLIGTVVGQGEENTAVQTADGVVEQRNRRVEIVIR